MSQQVLGQTFNEGVNSGGFAVVINGSTYIFDPFQVNPETQKIVRKGTLGQALGKMGTKTDSDATATVQVPFDGGNNPIWLVEGAFFTDPDGNSWWVLRASNHRRSGDVHKQEVELTLKLN